MKINLLCVGKLREKYLEDASAEYLKRLGRFCTVSKTVIPDKKIPDNASPATCEQIKASEGREILKKIGREKVCALCIEGKQKTSEEFAELLNNVFLTSNELTFVIGGSLGLSDEVKTRADICLSMSEMTFPHQLAQIILLEQIYRGFKINSNEKYHK